MMNINPLAALAANNLRGLAIPVLGVMNGEQENASNLALCLGADVRFSSKSNNFEKISSSDLLLQADSSTRARVFESIGNSSNLSKMIDFVSEDPHDEASRFAKMLCTKNPDAVTFAKELFQNTWHADVRAALLEETRLQEKIIPSWNMMRCAAMNLLPNWVSGVTSFKSRQVARL